MEEFDIVKFTDRIKEVIVDNIPFMYNEKLDKSKHSKRNPLHLKDAIKQDMPTSISTDTIVFDVGSPRLEKTHPYYHILEDSEVIQKKGRGTKKSKGSQEKISDKSARDYGVVKWSGKTFSQEYRKNVRGARSRAAKGTRVFVDSEGVVYKLNANASYYTNIHFQYIERTLDKTLPFIAQEFNMKMLRVQDTHLSDEWQMQQDTQAGIITPLNILDLLSSFEE